MKRIFLIAPITLVIILFIFVGYDKHHNTVEAPSRHQYDYYLTIPAIGEKVKVTFDNRGTEIDPYDDEIVRVASVD